jgi:hypothetical protein
MLLKKREYITYAPMAKQHPELSSNLADTPGTYLHGKDLSIFLGFVD